MQNRLTRCFSDTQHKKLAIYFTAGFPELSSTLSICCALEEARVDMIEIGIPFSDALADGSTIQSSNHSALKNGMTLQLLLRELQSLRKHVSAPVLLMGYLNPILQFGLKRFFAECSKIGIDGVIIPDLPLQEFNDCAKEAAEEHNISNVFLVTPNTTETRVRAYDQHSTGFIYAVSQAAVTGQALGSQKDLTWYLGRLQSLELKNPVMVGFGISNHHDFKTATCLCAGAVVGSAFIRELQLYGASASVIRDFTQGIKSGNL